MPPKSSATKTATKASKNTGQTRQKAAPKQPLPVADRLKRLFTSLCAQIDGGHFANAIKTCDKILRLEPHDPDALQTKLFLLLQTDQYAAALSMISGEDEQGEGHAFEKAYSLYRLHREDEAESVLDKLKTQEQAEDRGVVHLEAQLAYRQGHYQTAVDLYNQLLDTAEPDSEEQSDILTNLEAAQKHLDFINSGFLHALDALPQALSSGLQTAPPPQQQPASALASVAAAASAPAQRSAEDAAKRPKKVRMKRVPKGVVPGVTPPPDPERWLKKSERSTFTNRRRRGGGGATQGVVETPGSGAGQGGKGAGGGKGKRKK
ncbi:hypothetical protein PYCCODRAFT_1438972 [Trametes coccinea BRFM310]|uniref:Signal recognition particle subunit SRP72 n=1 Tax=Trametes coccinea (strain BRFM310) TaxID=1353009 RepID=A0A1Y2ICD7_TRAC3|nr:hypothetical protein PYCCODRAFT_1438972 [Trametes coccinea BRFM310]